MIYVEDIYIDDEMEEINRSLEELYIQEDPSTLLLSEDDNE